MKIYEAETLTAATKSRAKQYEELKKEVTALKKEFQGIVGLDNEFQGAGAAAIKNFYEAQIEVADAWMELFTTQISFLEGIPASLEEADLSGNTVVEVPFLDGEVSNGINQAKSLVDEQANDLQRILNSIDDILPLDMFDQKDFNEKITLAGHRLDDTVTKVENVDRQLVEEYDVSIGQENVAVGLFRALLDATKQDGHVSPMTFNQSAFKNSDVYQVKDEVAGQMKDYQTFKKEQAEARKIEQEMEELENRPWYEKAWDTTKTFTGEFTGYYDSIRASTGVDPVTGRKLSDAERIAAGAMAAAGFIPVVGWAGRAIKGGSALYKTAKGLNAADHALDAYKTNKGFSLLQKTEYGIYGLLAANGLGEAATGKDIFGNQLTEEQRQNGILMALGIGGVAGAAKVADKVASGTKFVPYSKEFAEKQVQYAKAFGREIGKVKVPLRISVDELATAYGNSYKHVTFNNTTIKDIVQKFAVKSNGGKGTGAIERLQRGKYADRLEYLHNKFGKMTSAELHKEINTPKLRRMVKDYSPSKVAQNWQGSYPYVGVDDYVDKLYKKGDIFYAGEPYPTGYFTTKEAILNADKNSKTIFEGLQVKPYWEKGMQTAIYRNKMGAYVLNVDIIGGNGIAKNNPQFGKGGMEQIFMADFNELLHNNYIRRLKNEEIILNNSEISFEEYSKIMNSIK
ncbi:T7SS effector LXG polymorphic toxin [Peribacillus simplex]|uniref:ribonuclease YeeF family protein n=2 Tax=Peribacillus TaxID=2675229 RepID=UPI00203E9559|nr:T7SS effector LXG polymorphic toxin [Peribacillus simplex]MCM3674566.1 T7SS effector LXG polymorphic toxin [Peribacillus simplex]